MAHSFEVGPNLRQPVVDGGLILSEDEKKIWLQVYCAALQSPMMMKEVDPLLLAQRCADQAIERLRRSTS